MRPASVAALIHVVAGHEHLWRYYGWLLAVLQLQTSLHHLGERDCVAGTAVALVSELAREIEAIDVSEVVALWKLRIRDVFCVLEAFLPVLGLGEGLLEFFI